MAVEPPVVSPATLSEALALRAEGGWRPLAGGTDLMVQLEAEVAEPPERVLDLSRLDELRGVSTDGYEVSIGALSTYTELRHSPVVSARLHALSEVAAHRRCGADPEPGAPSAATSATPPLPATRCRCCWRWMPSSSAPRPRGIREVPAREFWTAYRETVLREGRATRARPLRSRSRAAHAFPQGVARVRRRPSPRS